MQNFYVDLSHNVEPFLINIITDPDYKPNSTEFLKINYDIYSLTTLNPQNIYAYDKNEENPYNNQFERVFNCLLNFSNSQENDIKNDIDSLFHHLKTIKQRVKIINHVFNYLNKKRNSFIINANQCKFGQQIAFLYFTVFQKEFYDELVNKSIEYIEPLFSINPNQKADFTYLLNLNYICLCASKAPNSQNDLYEVFGHQKIIDGLNNLFKRVIHNLRIELLPEIVEQFYNFTRSIKNPSTRFTIYNNLYKFIIQNFVEQCNNKIMDESALKMIETESNYLKYLSVLSFHDSTVHYVEDFFNKFEDEFCNNLNNQTKVDDLSNDFINFLNYIDLFNQLTYKNIYGIDKEPFDEYITKTTKGKFRKLKLDKKFGDTFSVALSFIIDTFMKKGDNLTSNQNRLIDPNKMIQLLSYVTDRDVFISHHTNYMFFRIATRSTKSLKNEKDFLQRVSNFVQNNISLKNAFEIVEQAESEELESLNKQKLSYYVIKNSLAPPDRKYPSFPLPKDYKDIIGLAESKLANRNKGRRYEWIHYFTTCNVRLTKGKRFCLMTMSLGQLIIFTALSKHPNLSIKDLNEITNIDEDYIEVIIKSFRRCKVVTLKLTDENAQNSLQNATINLDDSFAPKQLVNLCDNWAQQYVPQQKNLDIQRKKSVQAAIVQIMKKYKRINTQQLVNQTLDKVLKLYAATEDDVMTCIRELVADEYLEEVDGGTEMSYIE